MPHRTVNDSDWPILYMVWGAALTLPRGACERDVPRSETLQRKFWKIKKWFLLNLTILVAFSG